MPKLSIIGRGMELFCVHGEDMQRHYFVVSEIPAPKREPDGKPRPNIPAEDMLALKTIFMEHGDRSDWRPPWERATSRVARFVYHWQEGGLDSPWITYEVDSPKGVRHVADWISSHSDALDRSAKLGAELAWIPGDVIVQTFSDGSTRRHCLLRTYPVGPRRPKVELTYATNIESEDTDKLRELFREHGTLRRSPSNPLDERSDGRY